MATSTVTTSSKALWTKWTLFNLSKFPSISHTNYCYIAASKWKRHLSINHYPSRPIDFHKNVSWRNLFQRQLRTNSVFVENNKGTSEKSHHTNRTTSEWNLAFSTKFHTSTRTYASEVRMRQDNGFLELTLPGQTLKLPYIWLRDHCRSDRFYNHQTSQKNVDFDLLERDLTPKAVQPPENAEGTLRITWKDDHTSEFPVQWLVENFYPGRFSRKVQRQFWNAKDMSSLPITSYEDHMNSEKGLAKTLANLVKYGFAIVDGAAVSEAGTQAVVERITFVKETLFGKVWSFTADGSRSDTAYSTIELGPHTDNTYLDNPSGLQVFHCLEHAGSGGETLLVDGFKAIVQLRKQDQGAFNLLCTTRVPHEYVEPPGPNSCGYHMYSLDTVVKVHPSSQEILHLRFNPYDRAPLNTVEPDAIPEFYKAYDTLSRIIGQSENHLWVKLKPGMVLLIDNWRVMHGRAAFDGKRIMSGCYVGREEWVSRARMFGAL